MASVSAKKVKKKISCLCTFKLWLDYHDKRQQSLNYTPVYMDTTDTTITMLYGNHRITIMAISDRVYVSIERRNHVSTADGITELP